MPHWVLPTSITDILLPLVPARFWLTKFLFSTTIKSVRHEFKIKGRAAADIAISAVWLYICIYTYIYVYTHIYIYIHTHIYIYISCIGIRTLCRKILLFDCAWASRRNRAVQNGKRCVSVF